MIRFVVHRKISFQEQVAKVRGRVTCWQFNDCSDMLRSNCPAYKNNAGRSCWNVQGTLCALSDDMSNLQSPAKCHHGDFFIKVHANLI
jgi:hypothetical protein